MPILPLIVLAMVSMGALAALRLVRVHFERTPLPDGRGRRLFLLGFVILPPLVLGAVMQPAASSGFLGGATSLPVYVLILAVLWFLMLSAAEVIGQWTHGRTGRLIRIALTGRESNPNDVYADPPMTAILAASMDIVGRRNAVFPRGPEFPAQIDRPSFRVDWDALEEATRTLEGQIADDRRLGLAVSYDVVTTAADARSRLDTLRRLADNHGQVWAAA